MDGHQITLDTNDLLTVTTPDGTIIITRLPTIGTQAAAYTNDGQPAASLTLPDTT